MYIISSFTIQAEVLPALPALLALKKCGTLG